MKILTTTLKKVWNFIDLLNSLTKTLIIFIIMLLFVMYFNLHSNKNIILDFIKLNELIESKADLYTIKIAPKIQECITIILKSDPDCYDVLLLNYHNSKKSIQGIRYLYLNCICESSKGVNDLPLKLYWTELEYIYYQDELSRIHNQGYLRIDNIEHIKYEFPKLYNLLAFSKAKSAAFYPIEGIDSSIGIIVILYKDTKKYNLGYYNSVISLLIQKLSTILDYPNVNNK